MLSSKNTQMVLLAILTLSVCGLLLPDPINSGGVLSWISVPFPLFLAAVMVHYAKRASLRGEPKSEAEILELAIIAVASMGVIAH